MADDTIMIHKITPSIKLQLMVETFGHSSKWSKQSQNSKKVPKVVKLTNKKMLLQDFGDFCNKQPNVPSLPGRKVRAPVYYIIFN